MSAVSNPKTFERWFELASRDFLTDVDPLSPNYHRLESCWQSATKAAEEKFTSTNTGSPKVFACEDCRACEECPFNIIIGGSTCLELRKNHRAGA